MIKDMCQEIMERQYDRLKLSKMFIVFKSVTLIWVTPVLRINSLKRFYVILAVFLAGKRDLFKVSDNQ